MKILATDGLEREALELLQQNGFEVDVRESCSETALLNILGEYDATIARTASKFTPEILRNRRKCKIICCATAGVDNVDIDAATRYGVVVMNVPGGNANAVAEHTLALMLNTSRQIGKSDAALKRGRWIKKEIMGGELQGKTLGIVGLGNIGTMVARKAQDLGMKVLAYDAYVEESRVLEAESFVDLDTLLARSDFVSLHVSLTEETRGMIGAREFALMKDGACIVNCARGEVLDESALKGELLSGRISAALDVYQGEPEPDPELIGLAQITTPHTAGTTAESRNFIARQCARQVIGALLHDRWENAVNLPPMDSALKPLANLSKTLGGFAARLWFVGEPTRFNEISFIYSGDKKEQDLRMVMRAGLAGLISTFSSRGSVSPVNAQVSAQNRGFKVKTTQTDGVGEYTSMLAIEISGKNSEGHRVEGVALGENKMQIVSIDGYNLTVEPSETMLVFVNEDRPGVIADVSSIIKRSRINIKRFNLSDRGNDGSAMAVLNLEKPLSRGALQKISEIRDKNGKTIKFLKQLRLR